MTRILRIDSSARHEGSVSRELGGRLIDRFGGDTTIIDRDLAHGVPQISEATLAAMWTPPEQRTDRHRADLAVADELIDELTSADVVVIGLPIYNFGPPASMKAWADLVARAGTTFRYTDAGPQGLLDDKPVFVVVASGGVPIGSEMDAASSWLRTFLGFLGLTDVTVLEAGQLNVDPERAITAARNRVDRLPLHSLAPAA